MNSAPIAAAGQGRQARSIGRRIWPRAIGTAATRICFCGGAGGAGVAAAPGGGRWFSDERTSAAVPPASKTATRNSTMLRPRMPPAQPAAGAKMVKSAAAAIATP